MLVMSLILSDRYPSIFTLFYFAFILSCIVVSPFPVKTLYSESINFLIANNCKMPKEVYIPFSSNSDPDTFDYLTTPLQICQTAEAEKEDERAHVFCTEIFEVLQNITCVDYNTSLPKIKSSRFSDDVCRDFFYMRNALPKQTEYIAGKLSDKSICKLLCSHEYEPLCKTLVWSYDVQAQITDALENKAKEEKNTDMGIPVPKDFNMKAQFINDSNIEQQPSNAEMSNENIRTGITGGSDIAPKQIKEVKNVPDGKNSNDLKDGILLNSKKSIPSLLSNKSVMVTDHQKGTSDLNTRPISQSENSKNFDLTNAEVNQQNVGVQTKEHLVDSNKKSNEDVNHEEAERQDNVQPKEQIPNENADQNANHLTSVSNENADQNANHLTSVNNENVDLNSNHLTSVSNVEINDQNEISSDISHTSNMNKDVTKNNNVQTNRKSENSPSIDNKLNNIDLQEQENKNTVNKMQTDSKTSTLVIKSKNTEKTKETQSVISSMITSDSPDLTTIQLISEKNYEDQAQDSGDQEQYKNHPTKDKDTEVKSSISITSDTNGIPVDAYMNSRNNLGHDDIQIVPAFPEQEDSHFFFYFLSIVLILMAGYLIFHNKQKIIALIVEGRHERRRRSHGAGYKKLETK